MKITKTTIREVDACDVCHREEEDESAAPRDWSWQPMPGDKWVCGACVKAAVEKCYPDLMTSRIQKEGVCHMLGDELPQHTMCRQGFPAMVVWNWCLVTCPECLKVKP